MNAVICGETHRVKFIRDDLIDDIKAPYFLKIGRIDQPNVPDMIEVNIFDIRRLYLSGEIDLVIIVIDGISLKNVANLKPFIKMLKLFGVENICFIKIKKNGRIWQRLLDPKKYWMPQVDINVIDSCNMNCKCCNHFSNLFTQDSFYQLETFERDLKKLSSLVDLETLYFVGGEPFLMKNLDEYITTARKYFPSTSLELLSNGILILQADEKILRTIHDNRVFLQISAYPPTKKYLQKILSRLDEFGIDHDIFDVKDFAKFLSSEDFSNPYVSMKNCIQQPCRYLRDGKIYKCAIDALHYKYTEKFNIHLPAATSINLDDENFLEMLDQLDGIIEMCSYCAEKVKFEEWKRSPDPKFDDWIV